MFIPSLKENIGMIYFQCKSNFKENVQNKNLFRYKEFLNLLLYNTAIHLIQVEKPCGRFEMFWEKHLIFSEIWHQLSKSVYSHNLKSQKGWKVLLLEVFLLDGVLTELCLYMFNLCTLDK